MPKNGGRRPTSWVWTTFRQTMDDAGREVWECPTCGEMLRPHATRLSEHWQRHHPESRNEEKGGLRQLRLKDFHDRRFTTHDHTKAIRTLACAVVMNGWALNSVVHPDVLSFWACLRPDFEPPSPYRLRYAFYLFRIFSFVDLLSTGKQSPSSSTLQKDKWRPGLQLQLACTFSWIIGSTTTDVLCLV